MSFFMTLQNKIIKYKIYAIILLVIPMKFKKVILIILISLLFTGCQKNNSNYEEEAQNEVNNAIIDKTNVTEDSIQESINYIKNNIESSSSNTTTLYYHATYLKTISVEDSTIGKLSLATINYLKTHKSQYKKNILKYLDVITTEDVSKTYQEYHTLNTIPELINNYKLEIEATTEDTSKIKKADLVKAYNYIESHIENPLEDEEIIEKIIYYSLYLSNLGHSNTLKELGEKTISYLQTLDSKDKEEVTKLLAEINLDSDTIISESYQEIVKE